MTAEIYITIDENYRDHWRPLYNSLKANSSIPFYFNIITEMEIAAEEPEILVIKVDPVIYEKKKFNRNITRAIYLRWLIPDISLSDKAIYLDVDTIVEGDIRELWDLDLEDNYIAAVPTYAERLDFVESIQGGNVKLRHLQNYLSGQLVINCKKWRNDNFKLKLMDYIAIHDTLDEAPLTVLCQGKTLELDKYWCVPACHVDNMTKHKSIKHVYDFSKAKLWHYSGSNKPWNKKDIRNYDVYKRYA